MSFQCNRNHADCGGRCSAIPEVMDFLKAINDENRLRIICVLSNTQGYTVNELTESLNIPQNLLSHHLKTLHTNGIVDKSKEGKSVYYSLKIKMLQEYIDLLEHTLGVKQPEWSG
jgi:DNA-binding transcriptional ArsR family regulator